MPDDILVSCENISKKFCRSLKRSLWYGVQDICSELNPFQKGAYCAGTDHKPKLRKNEFWAVNDISFELKRGECLGLIGHNGAGKSTLLKMLNGLIKPDHGRITMKGRIGALIELNAGFNPILTGRENVYIYGTILGFTKAEIDSKYDTIVEFAELGDFMGMPFKSFSSGMKVRLGFAVAAQMEPDVMIIDEVLAVGDVGYRTKCFNAIYEILKSSAVIFVSHSMPQVSRICSDIMVMNHGHTIYQGKDVGTGIEHFYTNFQNDNVPKDVIGGNGQANIQKILLNRNKSHYLNEISLGDELSIWMECDIDKAISNPNISLTIVTHDMYEVIQSSSYFAGIKLFNKSGKLNVEVNLGKIFLNPSTYSLCVTILEDKHGTVLYKCNNLCQLKVKGNFVGYSPIQIPGSWQVAE